MAKKEMIAMLLAGGQGSRLGVLTAKVAKPAVTFGGSYVWQEMDGQKTVYELACMEREKFGDRAEPACERLSSYLKILRECGYICYVNKI